MNRVWLLCVCWCTGVLATGQTLSTNPDTFAVQAVQILKSGQNLTGPNLAIKFDSAWISALTEDQKQKVHGSAMVIRQKNYSLYPTLRDYLVMVTGAFDQLSMEQLNQLLDVNLSAIESLNRTQYSLFLRETGAFLNDGYLHKARNVATRSNGGKIAKFEMIGGQAPRDFMSELLAKANELEQADTLQDLQDQLNNVVQEDAEDASSWDSGDSWNTDSNDPWSQPSPWDTPNEETSTDDWGTNDDWGNSNDDWGNSNDDWGNSNDDWGNTSSDSWGNTSDSNTPTPDPVPTRDTYSAISTDYVAIQKGKYRIPAIDGPVMTADSLTITIQTDYDSLVLNSVCGSHLLSSSIFIGTKAIINWPDNRLKLEGATVSLQDFYLRADRGSFNTPNASMVFPSLFEDSVSGTFSYQAVRTPVGPDYPNPVFSSYDGGIRLQLGERVTYIGGIEIKGNQLSGKAVSREKGILTLLDGKGRTVIFRGSEFVFREDSVVTSKNASMTILHGNDSITHPALQMEYSIIKNRLMAIRTKEYNVTPFHSSYHGLSFGVDMLKWDFQADSIDFNIMNGKDLVPATFESDNYFSHERYKRLTGIFGFHPIAAAVGYAKKYRIREFNVMELVSEYGMSEAMARGAMKMLHQYHFCEYNPASGVVILDELAFHYYESSARKKDYDNVYIPSVVSGAPNATLRLDSGNFLRVRGVDGFYVTTDYKVSLKPDVSEMVIGHDKDMVFHGEIDAGDFIYKGHNFHFDYDEFEIIMEKVDSITILMPLPDSLRVDGEDHKALSNHLTETSGTLYLNRPDNRSGKVKLEHYPYFVSESEATVYVDQPEYLNGAYDRSVFFVIPPMEMDDISSEDAGALIFPGSFQSGGIFPKFYDTLKIMPDQSLGFVHQIPDRGYQLYGTPARTYETITLSYGGIRGFGKIDFLKSSIFSEDFIYYPDSVTADGHYGVINPGSVGLASYPQAEMGSFRMYWLPRKDSMYLQTLKDPFSFYSGTAQLTGKANITQGGVYGSGTMLTRGSVAISQELSFKQFEYSANHADFEVLSDDPEKPAMAGEDISLTFDLRKNTADVHPEQSGVAAISFPYAQMKTSITNAVWDLEDSIITMTKPELVDINDSYFYSTRPELDSLAFNAGQAIYDIRNYELNVREIPFIEVADARLIPEGNETTILANSVLQTFTNAELIFEYPNAYHYLTKATIDIHSRNEFSGKATYELPINKDTFEIELHNFYLEEQISGKSKVTESSTASGEVFEATHLEIAPGFLYKGGVTLRVFKQALELEGFVKPDVQSIPGHNNWIGYTRKNDKTDVVVNMKTALYEDGDAALAGLHYGSMGKLYPSFLEKRITSGDDDFFLSKGQLSYNPTTQNYLIESPGKASGELYEGHTLIYNDSSQSIVFEGIVNFINPEMNEVVVRSSALGLGNRSTNEYSLDGFFAFDFKKIPTTVMELMAADLLDIVERLGNSVANDLTLELMLKISNIIGDPATRAFENGSLKDYIPVHNAAPVLNSSLVISGVKMQWNDTENAWHNTTKLGVSNIFLEDINAKMDGFIEFKKDDTGGDVFNLFIQAAPGSWYYFNYQEDGLLVYSSNRAFNAQIAEKSNFGATKPGELVLIAGQEQETLEFLNNFRKVYFGITEPYNLVYPDDASVEDESFDTIEEKKDDGFGF